MRDAYERAELEKVAAWHDLESDQAQNTRRWIDGFNLLGLRAQRHFAELAGLPFDPWEAVRRGCLQDGGEDFPGIDVKGTITEPVALRVAVSDALKAPYYVLVFVYRRCDEERYIGWATREMLEAAPRVPGKGHINRLLAKDKLLPGLPP